MAIQDRMNDLDGIVAAEIDENKEKEYKKIKNLLKEYGAKDDAIEDFIYDLRNKKEDNSFSMIDHYEMLKMTEEGKDLIEKAPTMKKEELEKAVKAYLGGK